ncbi:MAG: hypothetical protein JO254_10950 [Pseudolabrys sp.]|nr:hypothetical protein [Pseudolabrys sp.]
MTAGLAGGGIVAILLIAAWAITPSKQAPSNAPATTANTQANVQALDDLKDRLAKLEQSVAKIPPPDTNSSERLAGVENAMKAIGIALTALNQRSDDIAAALAASNKSSANTEALQQRIDALESAAKATQDKVAQNASADTAARFALAAVALRDVVGRGEPYAAQLDAVRTLNADAKLGILDPFASSGLPNDGALSRELAALLPQMLAASGASTETQGNFIERLQANAGKLVRIRPANEPAGDDASAILARLEVKTARNDVTGAQADIAKLPEKARAPADAWLKKVEARNAARTAADALVADATRGLGKS